MKKIIALICAAVMTLTLAGCGNGTNSSEASDSAVASVNSTENNSENSSENNSESISTGKFSLNNPNATEATKKVFNYIGEMYGSKIISGQQESTWVSDSVYTNKEQFEFDFIKDKTGKLPAIRGLDYMNNDFSGVNRRAKEWWENGGIVSICWHCGSDFSGEWNEAMKTVLADWDKALTEGTDEYKALIEGMDKGAAALKELADAGIPVLWRPFHEVDGAWFWWGKGGAENFKKLWTIMYDRYTNHWGLNNLIWVLGFSGNGVKTGGDKTNFADWYPGDEYVDCVGADTYDKGAQAKLYNAVHDVVGDRKIIPFHEVGTIPEPAELQSEGAKWAWFLTWHSSYISDSKNNSVEHLKAVYNDDYVITLDELPSFK